MRPTHDYRWGDGGGVIFVLVAPFGDHSQKQTAPLLQQVDINGLRW